MSESLRGSKALVTGASKGIGLAVARALVNEGAHVAICARSEKPLREALSSLREAAAKSGAKIIGQTADISRSAEVARFFDFASAELGGLDILVNNAGLGIFRPAAELTVEEWDRQIGVNLSGAFYCSREALHRF